MATRRLTIMPVARIHGHGGLEVTSSGSGATAALMVDEIPRYFEEILVGRHVAEVPALVSRLCRRCGGGHRLAAALALEDALGVKVSRQTKLLRELYLHGLFLESHIHHFFYMALPDFYGALGVAELRRECPQEMDVADNIIALGRRIQRFVGGRRVHPVSMVVGGFASLGTSEDLVKIGWAVQRHLRDAEGLVRFAGELRTPPFLARPVVQRAIRPKGKTYGHLGKTVVTQPGGTAALEAEVNTMREVPVSYSMASHFLAGGEPCLVGPAARVNLGHDRLTTRAREALRKAGRQLPCTDPFFQHVARLVEIVFSFERMMWVNEQLLHEGLQPEPGPVIQPSGRRRGVGAVELPQGTCYHDYEVDGGGHVTRARIYPPTAQVLPQMERDLTALATAMSDVPEAELRLSLEMLVRSYDPCFICAAR